MFKSAHKRLNFFFVLLILVAPLRSQTTQPDTALPGHLLSEADAFAQSSDVAVITLAAPGVHDPGPPAVEQYDFVKLTVLKGLRGVAQGDLICRYNRFDFSSRTPEQEPVVGSHYIAYLQYRGEYRNQKLYTILKFSNASEENVNKIEGSVKGQLNHKQ